MNVILPQRHPTSKEVADYLRLNEKQIYRLLREKKIPATRVTGKWLFSRSPKNRPPDMPRGRRTPDAAISSKADRPNDEDEHRENCFVDADHYGNRQEPADCPHRTGLIV
jgi:excisionase family DNA binding protein